MARDFAGETRRELANADGAKQWIAARVKTLHERVQAGDVLTRFGVQLRYHGHKEEQISCPFHGKDNKPSARFYPESIKGPSHVWCFVCQENWDCVGLWKKFSGFEGKFSGLLRDMEKTYNIDPPEMPRFGGGFIEEEPVDEVLEDAQRLLGVCERRLRNAKRAFDMRGYLVIGSVLDKVEHDITNKVIDGAKATEVLRKVLDKIGEKERSCPDG